MPLDDYLKAVPAVAESTARSMPGRAPGKLPPGPSPEEAAFRARFGEGRPFTGSDEPLESVMSPIEFAILSAGTGGLGTLATRALPALPGAAFAPGGAAALNVARGGLAGAGSMGGFEAAADVLSGENPLPDLPGNVALGALGGAALTGAVRGAGNALGARGRARPAPAPKVEAVGGKPAAGAAPAKAAAGSPAPAAAPAATAAVVEESWSPWGKGKPWFSMTQGELDAATDARFPRVGGAVDGMEVRKEVPNWQSIEGSLDDPMELPGIREIQMADFPHLTGRHYSARGQARINDLAEQLKESRSINPLIVAVTPDDMWIVEGATRIEALHKIGAKSFPAKVVIDARAMKDALRKSRLTAAMDERARRSRVRREARQPFTGQSAQQEAPMFADVMQQIRTDPEYLKRLNALGGGRVVTNQETIAKVLEVGPATVEEIKNIKAGVPVNEVDVARALVTKDYVQRKAFEAMAKGDEKAADDALATLREIEPGIQNLRATPGRATQVQAMFVEDRAVQAYGEIAEMRAKGVPFDQIRDAANKKLREINSAARMESAFRRITRPIQALETYATMAKLTSPVTHAINTTSNAMTFFASRPLERLARAGALKAQGMGPEAEATVKNLFGTTGGLRSGLKKYVTTLMDDAEDLGKVGEAAPIRFNFPRPLRPLDPFRQLAAADAFWRGIISDSELHTMAYASAKRQGLKGADFDKRVTDLLNDPPAPWLKKAEDVAKETTFQEDPDRFLGAVQKVRNVLPGSRFIIPFINTPYNLWKYQFQRSPLGVLSPRNLRGMGAGGEAAAESFGRLASGTGLALGAMALASRGEITGAYPDDPAERTLWEAEGRKPFSVLAGDRWISYGRFQPIGQYLANAVALKEAMENEDEALAHERFGNLLWASVQGIAEQPWLQGMSTIMDVRDGKPGAVDRLVSGTVTGMIPNLARDVRYQTDPVQRESRGVGPAIQNMIPGASQGLPARVDVLGREVGYDPNRVARASKVVSQTRETPETQAFRRAGYTPTAAPATVRVLVAGEKIALTPKEREQFEKETGAEVATRVRRVIASERFEKLDKEQRADRLKRAADGAREQVLNRWRSKLRKTGRAGRGKQ